MRGHFFTLLTITLFSQIASTNPNPWVAQHCSSYKDYYFCQNLEYKKRDEKSLKLDIYLPKNFSSQTKAVITIHGGCFYFGDKEDDKKLALKLVKAGFAAIPTNYTFAHDKAYPAAFEDLKDAVKWLKQETLPKLEINNTWIAALGASAGATLAGYLGTRAEPGQYSAYVNVVIDFFGRTDFTLPPRKINTDGIDDCPSIFAGKQNPQTKVKSADLDRKQYAVMNVAPVDGVKPASFFIAHAAGDYVVDVEHSNILFKSLYRTGGKEADLQLEIVPGNLHGFSKHAETLIWKKMIHFLKAQ